jgi:hypothetical protein
MKRNFWLTKVGQFSDLPTYVFLFPGPENPEFPSLKGGFLPLWLWLEKDKNIRKLPA